MGECMLFVTLQHYIIADTMWNSKLHIKQVQYNNGNKPFPTMGAMTSASGQGVFLKNRSVSLLKLHNKVDCA